MTDRPHAVAAVDVGTTAVKGVLLDRTGALIAAHEVPLETRRPVPEHVEQDPAAWWAALVEICAAWRAQGADLDTLGALSLSGQMQDVVLTRAGVAIHPAVLYSDTRAGAEAAEVTARLGVDVAAATGNPYGAASVLPKLRWLARHVPGVLAGDVHLHVGAAGVLTGRLCGEHVTDHTTAATTGLYDLGRATWWSEWLRTLGLAVVLPDLRWPHELAGRVRADAAAQTGLPVGLPVLTGLGDAGATTLGAGVLGEGERYVYLGTSGWVGAVRRRTPEPAGAGVFRLPLLHADDVLTVAPVSNVGSAHRWAADTFADGDYARLEALVARAAPATLLCLPYLDGERSPVSDPHARGVFVGVGGHSAAGDLARAVLEGVAYALKATSGTLGVVRPSLGGVVPVLGGGARSAVWCQILADVLDAPVTVPPDAALLPVLGSAYSAFAFLGWAPSFAAYRAQVLDQRAGTRFTPDPARARQYAAHSARWSDLYPAVQPLFRP
ncbi:xylulokinase [Deinococcus metalli]|uniref:Gluconate kinase n=1 Tax=Deinococcus metalli TaxID=1141878 RepID=A0A7W8KE29_9DEIO|nr:FGGY family carbohydrate kinase [Deinococcus metalli]MBB5376451.1 xylulokinase [Deinococcus metalli]GHF43939.1 gluconate kinase [Deinococcus metalli]